MLLGKCFKAQEGARLKMMKIYFNNILLIVFLFTTLNDSFAGSCPRVFSPAMQIDKENMDYLIEESKSNPDVKIEQIDISSNFNWSIPNSSDGAKVFFAIVGLVIIVAWVPYALKFLSDLSETDAPYCPWYKLGLNYRTFQSSSGDYSFAQMDASFTGLKLGVNSLSPDYSGLGLAFEIGSHSIRDKGLDATAKYNGAYLMLGPSLSFGPPNIGNISIDLMGGFSTNSDVSLIGEASLNLSIPLSTSNEKINPSLNIGLGTNYLDIRGDEGIFKNSDRYSSFLSIGGGIIF